MKHEKVPGVLDLAIKKGGYVLGTALAGPSQNARTSQTVTVHLKRGETVHVEMSKGSELYGQRHTSFSGVKVPTPGVRV